VWQPQIAKKVAKNPYFGVQGRSRSSLLVPPESSSAVLVMMHSKSVSICNRSLARLDDDLGQLEPGEVVDKFALTGPHKHNFAVGCHVFVVLFISLY